MTMDLTFEEKIEFLRSYLDDIQYRVGFDQSEIILHRYLISCLEELKMQIDELKEINNGN